MNNPISAQFIVLFSNKCNVKEECSGCISKIIQPSEKNESLHPLCKKEMNDE